MHLDFSDLKECQNITFQEKFILTLELAFSDIDISLDKTSKQVDICFEKALKTIKDEKIVLLVDEYVAPLTASLDNKKELKKVSEGDDVMDKVNEKICKLSDDEILQGIYVKEEMDSWMKKLDLKYAKEEGKKEANMETARKLLKKGMEIKDIIDITGITEKQIEILRKSL